MESFFEDSDTGDGGGGGGGVSDGDGGNAIGRSRGVLGEGVAGITFDVMVRLDGVVECAGRRGGVKKGDYSYFGRYNVDNN